MMKVFWNERYSTSEFIYGEKPNDYFKDKIKKIPAAKILMACEGEGRNSVYAAQNGWNVFAFDQSESAKDKAQFLANKNEVEIHYEVSDMENLNYQEKSFDVLAIVYAHFPASKRKEYHQKLSSYVKKNGILIMEVFNKQHVKNQALNPNAGGPRNEDMLYNLQEILSDFEDFEFKESFETSIDLNEGNHHQGKADVMRILGIKK